MSTKIYDILIDGLPQDLTVSRVQQGRSWSLAALSNGGAGICARMGDASAELLAPGTPLKEFAKGIYSKDLGEAALALAAMNAFYNTPQRVRELSAFCSMDVFCAQGIPLSGKTVGVIGHMKRTAENLSNADRVFIFELDPRPGDLPASREEELLPRCDLVIVTATALINHTLPQIIEWSKNGRVILLGPSAPMCPGLFRAGISRISGCILKNPDGFYDWNQENRGSPMGFCENYLLIDEKKDGS